jgi:hypothetical protein
MSVDRLIAVMLPLKAKTLCTTRRAKITCILSFVVLSVIHVTGQSARIPGQFIARRYCNFRLPGIWVSLYYVFFISTTYYIPLIIMFITNFGIIAILKSNYQKRQALQYGQDAKEKRKDGYITAMLLSVSVSSMIFLIPNKAIQFYYTYNLPATRQAVEIMNFLYSLSTCFLYCNYAMNFYVYTLPIAKFRREFREIIGCL